LISGVDRAQGGAVEALNVPVIEQANALHNGNIAARIAQNGLDANALLNGIAQGQGQRSGTGDISTDDVGGDLANQIAGGGSTSIDNILSGLDGQKQGAPANQTSISQGQGQSPAQAASQGGNQGTGSDINSSNIAGDLANQLAPKPGSSESSVADVAGDLANQLAPNGQGQLPPPPQAEAQQNGSNAQPIQVVSTVITEANGQKIATALVEAAPQQAAAPSPAAAGEAPTGELSSAPAEATSASSPAGGEAAAASSSSAAGQAPAEASFASKPAKTVFPAGKSALPAVAPVPWTNSPMAAGKSNSTSAMEAVAEPMPTVTPAEGKNSTVR
jgi:hypothetical protein